MSDVMPWRAMVVPETLSFTIVVLDRFNRHLTPNVAGGVIEIPETNPVFVPPLVASDMQEEVMLPLYCNTYETGSRTGEGYHYDWVAVTPS